jgi:hypothetical protein
LIQQTRSTAVSTVPSQAWFWLIAPQGKLASPVALASRMRSSTRAWAAGAGPDLAGELRLDFVATITVAHSEKENAAATCVC